MIIFCNYQMNIEDVKYEIAIKLSYDDLMALCHVDKNFATICNDNKFWLFRTYYDFPYSKLKKSSRQTYLSVHKKFDDFKESMGLTTIDNFDIDDFLNFDTRMTNEVSFHFDKNSYPCKIGTDYNLYLYPDLYVTDILGILNAPKLYPKKNFLMIEGPIGDLDSFVQQGKAIGLTEEQLLSLNLNKYQYYEFGLDVETTKEEIEEWLQLGFIHKY